MRGAGIPLGMSKAFLFAIALVACSVHAFRDEVVVDHNPSGYVYHMHTVTHPYMTNGMSIPNWDFGGSTIVSDEYIRLTPDRQSRAGFLWNKLAYNPPGKDDYPGFEINIEFRVHGQGKRLFGDGFAAWYTKERAQQGPVFGNRDQFIGLGVFFDTYSNKQQGHSQYISVMIGDGMQAYDHDTDGGDAKIAGCPMRFRSNREHTAFARIVYKDQLLRMYVDADGYGFEECFILRRVYLPRDYYFGVTAATGALADNHDIISFKVSEPSEMSEEERLKISERIEKDEEEERVKGPQEHHDPQYAGGIDLGNYDDEGMSLFTAIALIAVVVIVIFVAWYLMDEKKKKVARFDF